MLKKKISVFIFLLIILSSFYYKENKGSINKNDVFFGDSTISLGNKGYFKTIVKDNGYLILKNQTELYRKKYSNFDDSGFISSTSKQKKFKFVKQLLDHNKNYRIVLYTYFNNKKRDSIEFYRNYGSKNVKEYTCLSYLDLKTNKIWQIKFFYADDIILYESNNIKTDGKIKSDSLYYLDESLDVEMSNYKLYY